MEATCPRCSFTTPNVDEQLNASGLCPECGSQTYFSHGEPVRPNREGCVAATYEVDCAIGLPFIAVFVESRLPNLAPGAPPPAPSGDWGEKESMSDEEHSEPGAAESESGFGDDLFTSSDFPVSDPTPGLFESTDDPGKSPALASDQSWLEQPTGDVDPNTLPEQLREAEEADSRGEMPTGEAAFDAGPHSGAEDDDGGEDVDLGDFDSDPPLAERDRDGDVDVPIGASPGEPPAENDEPGTGTLTDEETASPPEEGDAPPDSPVEAPADADASAPAGAQAAHDETQSGEEDEVPPEDDAAAAAGTDSQGGLPAHLQLPAIDFSLPTEGTARTEGVSGGDVELPAHLNLPSFPQFDLPPVPGEDSEGERRMSDGTQVEGIAGAEGSFAQFDDHSQAGPALDPGAEAGTDTDGREDGWSVGAPAAGPPPIPPPMPAKSKSAPSAVEEGPAALPSLPSLPTIPSAEPVKRDPTLIDREVDEKIQGGGKGVFVWVALLVALLGTVVGAFLYKDVLIETVADPDSSVDASTLKAQKIRIESRELWAEASALYQKKKLEDAITKVHQSLALDPAFGKSHRLLGVVYAEMKKNERAVEHYRRYLQLEPKAPDAVEVQKIISDYEASQKKKRAEAAEKEAEEKRKRRRRR